MCVHLCLINFIGICKSTIFHASFCENKFFIWVLFSHQGHIFKVGIDALTVGGALPGRHVFHIGVFDPGGFLMPHYTANLIAENGSTTHQIALGINDPPGAYHVKVRDVLTGKMIEGELQKEAADYTGVKFETK